ncbi:MAG: hypothetical protein A2W80_07705 [Candidatus Riflebacteria bacterium GWC2_50_8]|nr:MAG: hypothetical protein A2W80_07705 [Candidatus Riflebacteria bacterium GWC2_50_8]
MYSENLKNLIAGRKPFLTVFWLMLPVEAATLSVVIFSILATMPAEKPIIDLKVVYIAISVIALSLAIIGIAVRSRLFRHQLDFVTDNFNKRQLQMQPPETANLEKGERVIFMAFGRDLALLIFCSSLFSTPVVMGLILTILSKEAHFFTVGVLLALILWKTQIPSPSTFISSFHQNVDPQYEEFASRQNEQQNSDDSSAL